MKYMLDTNMIISAKNARPEKVLDKLKDIDPSEVCISAITLAELEYGVCNSSDPERNCLALLLFLDNISVLPFDSLAAQEYGSIRSALRKKGQLIGANDLLIAAHAKSLNLTLITNNTGEFSRVEDLKQENWV